MRFVKTVFLALLFAYIPAIRAQEEPPGKSEPTYEDTFACPIVEVSATKVTVSRTVLGKTEKRAFLIKPDTRIEGKLKMKVKVTVGFVTTDEGDVARLIVAHPTMQKVAISALPSAFFFWPPSLLSLPVVRAPSASAPGGTGSVITEPAPI